MTQMLRALRRGAIPMLEAHIRLSLTDPMTVLSVSDGVEALLGFRPDDFLAGKVSLKNLIHTHDQDIAANLFSTEPNKASGTFNIRLRQANGRIRCVKGHYTKEPDASGREAILELQLQDAKSLWQGMGDQPMMVNFKAMMENTDDYIYFKDRNHVFNGASQTLVAITSPSEHWTDLLGLTDYDVFPEEYADVYYRLEKQVFAGIPVAHEIQETLDNDGNRGWVDNRKYPIKNADGEIIGLFGIARDITEHKLAEEQLRLTQFASDHAPDCIFWSDEQARFHYVNEAACRELGYAKEELLTMSVPDIDPDMPAAAWPAHWLELQEKHAITIESRHRRKDGSIFPAEVSANFVKFGNHEFNVAFTRNITNRKAVENEINSLAFYDSLTQLPNRRLLNDRLGKTMAASKRSNLYGAVMFLDLDNFKPLNDLHGHNVGDLLLIEVAHRLSGCVREVDTVARFGGDEFVVVLSELDEDKAESTAQAGIVAEKIRIALAEPYVLKAHSEENTETTIEHHCTSSIGVVLFIGHETSAEDILKWADMAMYQAKEAGRNQIRFYEPELQSRS